MDHTKLNVIKVATYVPQAIQLHHACSRYVKYVTWRVTLKHDRTAGAIIRPLNPNPSSNA